MDIFYVFLISGFMIFGVGVVFYSYKSLFILLLPFIYGYLSILISVLYLELVPSYIFEQGIWSYFNYSALVLSLFVSSAFFAAAVGYGISRNISSGNSLRGRKDVSGWIVFSILIFELMLVTHVFLSGSPLFNHGVTKFNFWTEKALIPQLSIFNWLLYLVVFWIGARAPFFIYDKFSFKRLMSFLVFLLAGIYYISWGNKFSAIMVLLFFYFIPCGVVYLWGGNRLSLKPKFVFFLCLVFIGTGVLILNQFSSYQGRGLNVSEQLIERIFVLQGHVWWGGFEKYLNFGADVSQGLVELQSVFGAGADNVFGMQYIMRLIAPDNLYNNYVADGVQFTGGYPAILLLVLGFFGAFLFNLIAWFCWGAFLFYFNWSISSGSNIRIFICSYLYLTSFSWFLHGSISSFINWKAFFVIFFVFSMELLVRVYRVRIERVGGSSEKV